MKTFLHFDKNIQCLNIYKDIYRYVMIMRWDEMKKWVDRFRIIITSNHNLSDIL